MTTTRMQVRRVAEELAGNFEYATLDKVREKIIADTNGALSPSNSTVKDELDAWRKDTFWPTYNVLGALPEDSQVPDEARRLFTEAYRMLVVHLIDKAKNDWENERRQYALQVDGAERGLAAQREAAEALEVQIAEVRGEMAQQSEQLNQALDANATLRHENSQLSADLNRALQLQAAHEREINEVRAAERYRADAAAERSRAEQNRLHLDIDALRQSVKGLEGTAAAAAAEVTRMRERASKADLELAAFKAETEALRQGHAREIAHLSEALAAAQTAAVSVDPVRKSAPTPRDRVVRPVRQSLRKPRAR